MIVVMFQDVTTHVYDGTDVIMLPVKRQFERVELTPEVIGLCSSLLTVFYYLYQGGYDFACLSVSRITPKLVDEFLLSFFFFWGGEVGCVPSNNIDFGGDPECGSLCDAEFGLQCGTRTS